MQHMSAQGVDERMINVHYYYLHKSPNHNQKAGLQLLTQHSQRQLSQVKTGQQEARLSIYNSPLYNRKKNHIFQEGTPEL